MTITEDIDVVVTTNAVSWRGQSIKLREQAAVFLACCVDALPNPAPREVIIKRLWPNTAGQDSATDLDLLSLLAVHLRSQLPRIGLALQTIPGVGYRLVECGEGA